MQRPWIINVKGIGIGLTRLGCSSNLVFFFWVIELFVTNDVDEVWISSVKRAQLPPIPLLESAASSRMITGVVPATTPPTLKLGIIECNVLKKKMV